MDARRHSLLRRWGVYLLLFCAGCLLGHAMHGHLIRIQSTAAGPSASATRLNPVTVTNPMMDAPASLAMVTKAPGGVMPLASVALDDASAAVRLEAAHELGERGDAISVQVLEQVLYDSDRRVRITAMDALSMQPTLTTLDIVTRALAHPDPRVRDLAQQLREELLAGSGSSMRVTGP